MEPQNREQRRHPETLDEQPAKPGHDEPKHSPEEEMLARERQQDDFSVRAKNSGHGKKTADKWNQ
jgi:hypothetical protein